jgi:hypothetical protein
VRTALLVVGLLAGCSLYHDIEDDAGFRGVKLGTDPSTQDGLVRQSARETGDAIWVDAAPQPRWGKAPITVRYHAFRDRLWKIVVHTDDSKALLPAVTGRYGTPSFATPWLWEGETIRMRFQGTEYDSTATVTLVHKPLEAAREQALASEAGP